MKNPLRFIQVKQEGFRITWPTKDFDWLSNGIGLASMATIFFLLLDQVLDFSEIFF